METTEKTKCLIIGSGPAGFTAAIYASRSELSPILYEGMVPGGQLTITTEIENFPGYPEGITGTAMMEDLRKQAARFGTDIRNGEVTNIDTTVRPFRVTIDGNKVIEADTLIFATGASAKYLGLPNEVKYAGMGVSACATCDGFFYRKKVVAVVGGGDTACEEAVYLSHLAKQVYLLVRRNELRASNIMQERVKNTENITILWETQAEGLYGENGVEGAYIVKHKGTDKEVREQLPIDGFFLAIGHKPNADLLKGQVELDEHGYILTKPYTAETNIPGLFAAGDVADPRYRQAITAAASGCRAAIDAKNYILMNNL
ncbi:MAG: thioredoxin-disulfide reductase [Bacteroidaceae bacterium]|nr:thioredoxin-disulfide reductase [Bacteroidaceae bacterium]